MKIQSAKAKGRKLQQWVRDQILDLFPRLTADDVRSTGMGQSGTDVQLSAAGKRKFNYGVECKARETYKGLYETYEQANGHSDGENLVVIKMNRKEPLVVISASHFFTLHKEIECLKKNLRQKTAK